MNNKSPVHDLTWIYPAMNKSKLFLFLESPIGLKLFPIQN